MQNQKNQDAIGLRDSVNGTAEGTCDGIWHGIFLLKLWLAHPTGFSHSMVLVDTAS